jgi:hypothetical protein
LGHPLFWTIPTAMLKGSAAAGEIACFDMAGMKLPACRSATGHS